ncbi:hypothetical protein J6590_072178 [Homalodisca vitripennis]|nr:hypothetical protein J6590_072178 [Homalodisca vitripennis]
MLLDKEKANSIKSNNSDLSGDIFWHNTTEGSAERQDFFVSSAETRRNLSPGGDEVEGLSALGGVEGGPVITSHPSLSAASRAPSELDIERTLISSLEELPCNSLTIQHFLSKEDERSRAGYQLIGEVLITSMALVPLADSSYQCATAWNLSKEDERSGAGYQLIGEVLVTSVALVPLADSSYQCATALSKEDERSGAGYQLIGGVLVTSMALVLLAAVSYQCATT